MKSITINRPLVLLVLLFIYGCNLADSTDNSLPRTPFPSLSEYLLSDFNLNQQYQYWEIRQGSNNPAAASPYTTLFSYDDLSLNTLTTIQLSAFDAATSDTGLFSYCLPGYCPVYGVAILDNNITLLTTLSQLLAFFGTIDSTAELHIWLWANHYTPLYYQEVNSGYLVLADWDNLCGTRGKDLLFVDNNGTVTKQKTLSTEKYFACV